MDKEELRVLLIKYASDSCTKEERKKVERLILKHPMLKQWEWRDQAHKDLSDNLIQAGLFTHIDAQLRKKGRAKMLRMWSRIAAMLAIMGGLTYYLQKPVEDVENVQIITQAIEEKSNEITLTYANGEVVSLEENETFSNLAEAALTPDTSVSESVELEKFNMVHVPSARQFSFILMDGTKVWLNAGSTLKFPVKFNKRERKVHLEGEGYFEIAHENNRPFSVKTGEAETLVTGTKFNVMAHPLDSKVRTSLFEGSVNFLLRGKTYALQPGNEILADKRSGITETHAFDMDGVLAWRNGYFVFDNMDIESIMLHVGRWYNITVKTKGILPNKRIGGTFPNTASLDELLKDIELLSGVKFVRKGREVELVL